MNGSQGRQLIYLLLTVSGTVLTQRANWQFIQENGGFALGEFIAQAGATAAGQSLSWEVAAVEIKIAAVQHFYQNCICIPAISILHN